MAGRVFPSEGVFCEEVKGCAEDGQRCLDGWLSGWRVMEGTIDRASAGGRGGVHPGFLPGSYCRAVGGLSQMGYARARDRYRAGGSRKGQQRET
jgi:hypothetical protein